MNRMIVLLVLLTAGCQKPEDQIQTYRVSKDVDTSLPMAGVAATAASGTDMTTMGNQLGLKAAASTQDISWTTPSRWAEQTPSSMRVGSFLVQGSDGQTADVSVVPLSGDAGGTLSNINRWRGQINLPPLSDGDLAANSQTITPHGRAMVLVDFVSTDALIDNQFKKRVLAATYIQGNRSWFFKMMGDDQTVESAKPAFLTFLKSLHFKTS